MCITFEQLSLCIMTFEQLSLCIKLYELIKDSSSACLYDSLALSLSLTHQFTCVTSTNVQILTAEELRSRVCY